MDRAAGHHAHVKVGETDGDETGPGEQHVALVQEGYATPGTETGKAERRAREAMQLSASEMPQRVAGESVEGEQGHVQRQDDRTDTHSETTSKKERAEGILPKKNEEQNREVEEIAVNILEDKRKRGFATIVAARRLTHRAGGGGEKKNAGISVPLGGRSRAENEKAEGR